MEAADRAQRLRAQASAVVKLTQVFVDTCLEEGIDLQTAWEAIGRTFSFSQESVAVAKQSSPSSQSEKLTKEEKQKAKTAAREAKARRLNLSPSEINLTKAEEKQAVDEALRRKVNGQSVIPNSQKTNSGGGSRGTKSKQDRQPVPTKLEQVTITVAPAAEDLEDLDQGLAAKGARATQKTRIESLKRNLVRSNPAGKEHPTVLHLVAFANAYSRLRTQWESFQQRFNTDNMKDPLEEIPDPFRQPKCSSVIQVATRDLGKQTDSQNTWILQDEGKSFFDRDRPSDVCPPILALVLSPEVLTELDPQWGTWYPKTWNHPYDWDKAQEDWNKFFPPPV